MKLCGTCLRLHGKLTYFSTFTFLSFFFLFIPGFVVLMRFFRCAFFLLTPAMFTTTHVKGRYCQAFPVQKHWNLVAPDSLVQRVIKNGGKLWRRGRGLKTVLGAKNAKWSQEVNKEKGFHLLRSVRAPNFTLVSLQSTTFGRYLMNSIGELRVMSHILHVCVTHTWVKKLTFGICLVIEECANSNLVS